MCGLLGVHSANAETVTIGAEDDWYPYSRVQNGQPKGMAVDLVREAFGSVGIDVQFQSLPYSRCLALARMGSVAGCFDTARNTRLEPQYLWPFQPLFTARVQIFGRADVSQRNLQLKDLEGREVGVTAAYEYGEAFDSNPRVRRVVSDRDLQSFRKLLNGKVEFVVIYEKVANHLLEKHAHEFKGRIKPVGEVGETGLYLALSKTAPNARMTAEWFDRGLATILRNGRYKAIEQSWK
ncbi:substrate-binding periplasmic protein [Parachitinimonas caeni]|uniref:Transporter substrate-binding domain-containing protein n=1 Tax=Parachitinimonas caeni TaxID=3031301 RepID=A0ABT7DTH0_9NEIS|nr:transporter substrate-binding domain-containing protein [Parachitinimonas caeni]MDK2123379.1 transporter substrate-binding domain-containing protein [Parachitinimonas caeni]